MAAPAPSVDVVTIPGAGPRAGKTLGLSIACELMHNHLPGSPVEPTTDIAVVQDVAGNPMIFSIGADKALRLIRTDPGSPTGFSTIDLTAHFTGSDGAAAFDVSEDLKGNITLVVAMLRNAGPATNLFIAPLLSNDSAKTDWATFDRLAVPVAGIDPTFAATRIRMGNSDDGKAPFVTIVGALGSQQVYYQLAHTDHPAARFAFPENVPADPKALLDISIGYAFGERGVWYLYGLGSNQTLECTTLASADSGPLTYDYSPGYKGIPRSWRYNCVATPTGQSTNPFNIASDVYVGCDDGVRLFVGGRTDSPPQTVAAGIKDVHQLIVKQDEAGIAVWALCSPDRLYYIYGHKGGASYRWNAPVLFAQDVVHLAPMRVRTRRTNELFVVTSDLSVVHHWQDPTSTLWQKRVIRTAKSDYLINVPTFTTRLHLEDADGNPLGGATLNVTASEWTYVTINGLVYALDRDVALPVTTDELGSITIIGLAADIAPPILHVASPVYEGVVNVYANGKIQAGLQAIRSGADLANARTANGPVVDPSTTKDTLDGVAANLGQLTSATGGYVAGTRPAGTTFVAIDGVKHTGALDVSHLPASFAVGMRVRAGAWQPHPEPKVAAMAVTARHSGLGGVIDDIETFVGDAFHWLETAFADGIALVEKGLTTLKDGVSFVIHKVEDGLQLVLDLAGKTLTLAIKSFGAVFKALNWILNLIKVGLEKVLAWLGHLFGWDEIWKAHKIIANVLKSGLDCAVDRASREIDSWRATVKRELPALAQSIKSFVLPNEAQALRPQQMASQQSKTAEARAGRTPAGSFTSYHIQHGGMLDGSSPTASAKPPAASHPIDSIGRFYADVVVVEVDKITSDLKRIVGDIFDLIRDPSHTVGQLFKLFGDAVDLVFDAIGAIIDGALALAELLLQEVRKLLEDAIDLPFISSFYAFVTGLLGESETLTVVNGMALLVAIPFVEICRLAGQHPFAGAETAMMDPHVIDHVTRSPGERQIVAHMAGGPQIARAPMLMMSDPTPPEAPHDNALAIYRRWGSAVGGIAGVVGSVCAYKNARAEDPSKVVGLVGAAANIVRNAFTFPSTYPPAKLSAWCISTVFIIVDPIVMLIPTEDPNLLAMIVKEALKRGSRCTFAVCRGISGLICSIVDDVKVDRKKLSLPADIFSNLAAFCNGGSFLLQPPVLTGIGLAFSVISSGSAIIIAGLDEGSKLDPISNVGG